MISLKRSSFISSKLIFTIAIITTPFIVFGRGIVDEILYLIISLYFFSDLINKKIYKKNIYNQNKIALFLLAYLIVNTCFSLFLLYPENDLRGYNLSSLRLLTIYVSFLIFLLYSNNDKYVNYNHNYYFKLIFSLNLVLWISYWIILEILGLNWELQQAVTYAGTKYASFTPAVGLLFILKNTEEKNLFSTKNIFFPYFILCFFASYVYKSRLLFFISILVSILLLMKTKRILTKSILGFSIIFLGLTQNIYTVQQSSTYSPPQMEESSFINIDKLKNIGNSAMFLVNPRISDQDVLNEIKCAFKLVSGSDSKVQIFFGYGTSSHKSVLYECYGAARSTPGAPVRPVAVVAFMIDYGFLGIFLGLLLLTKLIIVAVLRLKSIEFLLIYLLCFSFLFVVNILDHSLLWVIFILRYLEITETQKL